MYNVYQKCINNIWSIRNLVLHILILDIEVVIWGQAYAVVTKTSLNGLNQNLFHTDTMPIIDWTVLQDNCFLCHDLVMWLCHLYSGSSHSLLKGRAGWEKWVGSYYHLYLWVCSGCSGGLPQIPCEVWSNHIPGVTELDADGSPQVPPHELSTRKRSI